MNFAKTFDLNGTQVLMFIDEVENDVGREVWGIVTKAFLDDRVITVVSSYAEDKELDEVVKIFENTPNDEIKEALIKIFGAIYPPISRALA